ncbi:MAG: hypothetical protein HYS18_13820 [Burkholderiales bacterium]|nr:hypothetical protein [Burkholderiales bacterium]
MKSKFIAVLAAVVLSACAGSGKIDWNGARQLKAGMTEKEVLTLMGTPYSVRTSGPSTKLLVWVHVNGMTGMHQSLALPIENGVLKQAPSIPDNF